MKLTARTVETFKPPATGRVELWDSSLPGFGIRITDKGSRSWVLMYRMTGGGPKRRMTLGTYPMLSLAEARQGAGEALQMVERGVDPAAEKKAAAKRAGPSAALVRSADTVASVAAEYLERHARRNTRRPDEVARLFRLHLLPTLGDRDITTVTRRDIRDLIDRIIDAGKPVQANRVQAATHALLVWAVGREIIEINPAAGLRRQTKETARDRVLTNDELRAVWNAIDGLGYPAGPLFKLLILTAARRDEVRKMRWSEIDFQKGVWTLPADRSKNGVAHSIPLSTVAREVLGEMPRFPGVDYVFSAKGSGYCYTNLQKPKGAIDRITGVTRWTLHDLRRTAATGMGELGISGETIARVLNHSERAIAGVTSRYARADHSASKREALEAWAQHVLKLADPVLDVQPSGGLG
jgi:integrase